jgi:hypothetical protein
VKWLILLILLIPRPAFAGFCAACAHPHFAAQTDRHPLLVAAPLSFTQWHAGEIGGAEITTAEIDWAISLGLTERWFVDAVVPLRYRSVDPGTSPVASSEDFGFADSQVFVRRRIFDRTDNDGFDFDVRAGLTLPFAGTSASDRSALPFGQQVVQAVIGVQAVLPLDDGELSFFGWARAPLHASARGFQAGPRASAGAGYTFLFDAFSLEIAAGIYAELADRWDDVRVPVTGHRDFFVRSALRIFQDSELPTELAIVLPLTFSSDDPATLHSPGSLTLTFDRAFDL